MKGDFKMINKIENYYLKGNKEEIRKQLENMDYYKRELYKIDGTIKDKYVPIILELSTQIEKKHKYYGKRWLVSRWRKQLDTSQFDRIYTVVKAFKLTYKEGNYGKRNGLENDYIEVIKDKRKKFYNI